jgi:hypothetical protein
MGQEKTKGAQEHFGRLLIDLGKLAFASLVLGTALKGNVDQVLLLIYGLIGSVGALLLGSWLVLRNRRG